MPGVKKWFWLSRKAHGDFSFDAQAGCSTITEETKVVHPPFFQSHSASYAKRRAHYFRFLGGFCTFKRTPDVRRARGTLFWPEMARELTKSDGTQTIRSEIVRGIVSENPGSTNLLRKKTSNTPHMQALFGINLFAEVCADFFFTKDCFFPPKV